MDKYHETKMGEDALEIVSCTKKPSLVFGKHLQDNSLLLFSSFSLKET